MTRDWEIAEQQTALITALRRQKKMWNDLRAWATDNLTFYKGGKMQSMAESVHGEAQMSELLAKMGELEGGK